MRSIFILANKRIVFDVKDTTSEPVYFAVDGLAIDTKGFLYVAMNNGSAVYKIDPSYVYFKHDF